MKLEPGMAYKQSTLNKVFAFLSIIFLFSVLGVFLDDYIRPWKGWQIKALKVKEEKVKKDIEKAMGGISKESIAQAEERIEQGRILASERQDVVNKLEEELNDIGAQIHSKKLELSVYNGLVAELTFTWEIATSKGKSNAPSLKKRLDKNRILFATTREKIKSLEKAEKALMKKVNENQKELIEAEKDYKDLLGQVDLMKIALAKTDVTNPVFLIRNMPFLDFMDPTIKVEQVVLDNITDDRYFQQVPKVDRCMTCHVFIDKAGYEDQEQPFRTHPNLELMVGVDAVHPMTEFGCTTCHGGEGHRINDFNSIAHTPNDEKQKEEWVAKYNWHAPHKIPQPMHKLKYTEASCFKCHQDVEYIPMADTWNKGKDLMEGYGCYGCHVIPGFEHKKKPGPSLKKLAGKLDKNWVKNWVWDPFGFNPHSRMPSFFMQSNNTREDHQKKNIAEVNTMVEYLYEQTESYKPHARYTGGNASRGKELIQTVGCIACHQVEGIKVSEKVGALRGPYLTGTGSKVSANWLVSWLKKPDHYQEDTIMPSFRLSDREAQDMTAYLMGLKNKIFVDKKFAPLDKDLRDDLLVEYFSAFDTLDGAKASLAALSDRERTIELGKRSLGKYGCFSCHSINGFDPNRAPIGPNLSKEGSKPVHQFGFGHEHDIEHSRDAWISAHLENPRRWDGGTDKPFKDLTRMPNFHLEKDEIDAMVTTIIGYTGEFVPEKGVKRLNAGEKKYADAQKVMAKYNCYGCHKIDGIGGTIGAAYADDLNEGPPFLVGQGHRVHADWFYHFLGNVTPIRPWLKVRMPSFNLSNTEINTIVTGFQAISNQVTFEETPERVEWEPGEKRAAKALWDSYACASCHTIGFNKDEPTAPNLYLAKRRLRASWMDKWLSGPAKILPYTVMPNFWEDGVSQDEEILGGDPERQRKALIKYLIEIGYDNFQGKMNKSAGNR